LTAPYRRAGADARLDIRLTPKGGRDRIDGVKILADGRAVVVARVRAAPEHGEANHALERLVAEWIGVPPSSVRIASGATSRIKTLAIEGGGDELEAAMARLGAS